MCEGQICRVLRVNADGTVLADVGPRHITVSLLTLSEPVADGDWLLVHAGLALSRLTDDDVADAIELRGPGR